MGTGGYIKPHEAKLDLLKRVVDCGLIAAVHSLAAHFYSAPWTPGQTLATVTAILVFLFVAESTGLYKGPRTARFFRDVTKVLGAWVLAVPVLLLLAFSTKVSADYSRVVTFGWFVAAPLVLIAWRAVHRGVVGELRARGRNTRNAVFVGATDSAKELAARLSANPAYGMRVHGYYDDRGTDRTVEMPAEAGAFLGNIDRLVEAAWDGVHDVIYVTLPLRAESRIAELTERLADTTASVYVVPNLLISDLMRADWSYVDDMPVVSVFESPFYGVDGWLKRVEDIILGTIIMGIIAIPMAVIALGVKLTSPGPVFFVQRRYGLQGKEIRVLKFRSMTVCEDGGEVKQATKGDARVTPFGAFLRRTSMDELPQFLQVLTGEMSIVGPRPHAVSHNEEYRRLIHGYMLRHKVKPGITGWAQVNGWRGETDTLEKMEKRVAHDLHYIQHWSLLLDLKIIFRTVFGAATSNNAY